MTRMTALYLATTLGLIVSPDTHSQLGGLFGAGPPRAFQESRVAGTGDPASDQTAAEFIAETTERLDGDCSQDWYDADGIFILECLWRNTQDDWLLIFYLDWYPEFELTRLYVSEAFTGRQWGPENVSGLLAMLPRTDAELRIHTQNQAELAERYERMRTKYWSEFRSRAYAEACIAPLIDENGEGNPEYWAALSVQHNLFNEAQYLRDDYEPGSIRSGDVDGYFRFETRVLDLLAEWETIRARLGCL